MRYQVDLQELSDICSYFVDRFAIIIVYDIDASLLFSTMHNYT